MTQLRDSKKKEKKKKTGQKNTSAPSATACKVGRETLLRVVSQNWKSVGAEWPAHADQRRNSLADSSCGRRTCTYSLGGIRLRRPVAPVCQSHTQTPLPVCSQCVGNRGLTYLWGLIKEADVFLRCRARLLKAGENHAEQTGLDVAALPVFSPTFNFNSHFATPSNMTLGVSGSRSAACVVVKRPRRHLD